MFSLNIVDTDWFLDLPLSAQALYFHLSMRADDDGFIDSPKSIMRKIGSNQNDFDLLIAKKFILKFESGVIVIKHWRIHNYIQNDRYTPTRFQDEMGQLDIREDKAYTEKNDDVSILDTECVPSINTKSISKSISNNNIKSNKDKRPYGEMQNVMLTDEEYIKLKEKFPKDYDIWIERIGYYIASKGKKYKSHYATILNWARKEQDNKPATSSKVKDDLSEYDILD